MLLSCPFRLISTLVFVVVCVACGESIPTTPAQSVPEAHIDPELQPFLESYVDDAARAGAPVEPDRLAELKRLEWVDEVEGAGDGEELNLGQCARGNENSIRASERFRTIKITRPETAGIHLNRAQGQLTLKAIVYHELGHCLHNYHGHRPVAEQVIMSAALPEKRFSEFNELLVEHFRMFR